MLLVLPWWITNVKGNSHLKWSTLTDIVHLKVDFNLNIYKAQKVPYTKLIALSDYQNMIDEKRKKEQEIYTENTRSTIVSIVLTSPKANEAIGCCHWFLWFSHLLPTPPISVLSLKFLIARIGGHVTDFTVKFRD